MDGAEHQGEASRIRASYLSRDASDINKRYTFSNPAFVYHMQERERDILSILAEESIDLSVTRVLEVGCGTGHILQRFLEFGAGQAMGIDYMEHRLRIGATRYPNVLLLLGDGVAIPCRDATFDLVMQFMCVSSVLDYEVRRLIAQEMWRVLKPGGAILSYDLRTTPRAVLFVNKVLEWLSLRRTSGMQAASDGHITPTRPLDIEDLQRLFENGTMRYRTTSLAYGIAGLAKKSWMLATFLSMVPALRTHYLVLIRKPG
jgi:ubiquinone/menaquinone biosynthesis C-methylase UbiE